MVRTPDWVRMLKPQQDKSGSEEEEDHCEEHCRTCGRSHHQWTPCGRAAELLTSQELERNAQAAQVFHDVWDQEDELREQEAERKRIRSLLTLTEPAEFRNLDCIFAC